MLIAVCYAVAVATSCSLATAPAGSTTYGTGSKRILFIGNSLTAANQMPALLVALAESAKVSPLPTADIDWHPDFALIDHWSIGEPQPLIAKGKYSVVVMQQGPSSVEVNRDTLRLAAKLFAPLIRAAGGVPAMLAVWPTSNRLVDFDRATESYRLARRRRRNDDPERRCAPLGAATSAGVLFVGRIASVRYSIRTRWRCPVWNPSMTDRSSVCRQSPSARWEHLSLDAATAKLIQESADEANRQFGSKGTP
jgi:hypothetical protein